MSSTFEWKTLRSEPPSGMTSARATVRGTSEVYPTFTTRSAGSTWTLKPTHLGTPGTEHASDTHFRCSRLPVDSASKKSTPASTRISACSLRLARACSAVMATRRTAPFDRGSLPVPSPKLETDPAM